MGSSDLYRRDSDGRTSLFDAAAGGDIEAVKRIVYSLTGTGMCPQRLSLLDIKDSTGLTAADIAEQNGHKEVADLLRSEQMRMEFFE